MDSEIILLRDSDWSMIDGEACKVTAFNPHAAVENGRIRAANAMPYASIEFVCKDSPTAMTGFITHKADFLNLWEVFNQRTVARDEVVIVFWIKKHYRKYASGPYRLLARFMGSFMPGLAIMVCRQGAFELITDPNHRPELKGEARFLAERPIAEWKPPGLD